MKVGIADLVKRLTFTGDRPFDRVRIIAGDRER
jgi:hypothetical protein